MQVGVFGGTFDPPHLGHLILAAEALDQLRLDRILWVLTQDPPHKHGQMIRPWEERFDMVRLATAGDPTFEISRVDIDRPGPHYAVDTMGILASQLPQTSLFYLIGGDSLHDLPSWHQPRQFLESCAGLGVMRRPGDSINLDALEGVLPGISARVHFITAPLLEISSRDIRERIASGRPFRYYLTPAVYQYILETNIYQKK
jgi:nicotinate-nucleotide adenylyltransferase